MHYTNRYKISVIALSHADENGAIIPNQSTITKPGDIVTIIGTEKDVEAFEAVATA